VNKISSKTLTDQLRSLVATFTLTVIFDLVIAVELGMVLAAILFIKRVSETTEVSRVTGDDVLESPEQLAQGKEIPENVLVYRIFGPFLFGAAEKMSDALERVDQLPRVLILRLHLVTAMDATALNALESIIERFQHHGSTVVLSGLHRQPLDMLRKAGFIDVIGRENLCAHFDPALSRAKAILPAPDLSKGCADQIRPASIRISFLTDWPTTPLVLPTSHAASAT
jgi:SulP family sulfate permease